jgi:hypothetical protein
MNEKIIHIAPAGWNSKKRFFAIVVALMFAVNFLIAKDKNSISFFVLSVFITLISIWVYRSAVIEISSKEIKVIWILFVIKSQKIGSIHQLQEVKVQRRPSLSEYLIEFVFNDGTTFTLPQNHNYEKVKAYCREIQDAVESFKADVKFTY